MSNTADAEESSSSPNRPIVLVSTHRDKVDTEVAEKRKAFLVADPCDLMIQSGARIYQLDNRYKSCSEIAADILKAQPSFLKIQKEMAKEFQYQHLSRTDVGIDASQELEEQISNEQTNIQTTNELFCGTFETPEMKGGLQRTLQESE
jgi:hypothetical protein